MIKQFDSFENAALEVARLRSRGHFARVCEESTGYFWGPAAVGGVRVICSEEPTKEEDFIPLSKSPILEFLIGFLRMVVIGLSVLAVCFLGYSLLSEAFSDPLGFVIVVLAIGVVVAMSLVASALFSLLVNKVISRSILRSSFGSWVVNGLFILIVGILVACLPVIGSGF